MNLDSLKNAPEFNIVNKNGIKFSCNYFVIIYMKDFAPYMLKSFQQREKQGSINHLMAIEASISRFKSKDCFLGFKTSKKVGNAVKRNKIKRRFKTLVREYSNNTLLLQASALIFIARNQINEIEFNTLKEEFERAMQYFTRKTNRISTTG